MNRPVEWTEHAPISACIGCGACCKRAPGIYLPSDFGPDWQARVRELLAAGDTQIDWWEGDPRFESDWPDGADEPVHERRRDDWPDVPRLSRACYVRPATTLTRGLPFDACWGGRCVHLSDETGCTLERSGMPSQCKALEPTDDHVNGRCWSPLSKEECAVAWIPYSLELEDIGREFCSTS